MSVTAPKITKQVKMSIEYVDEQDLRITIEGKAVMVHFAEDKLSVTVNGLAKDESVSPRTFDLVTAAISIARAILPMFYA